MRKLWSDSDIETLKVLYPDNRCIDIAEILARSTRSIYAAARNLKLSKSDEFKKSELLRSVAVLLDKGAKYRFKKQHIPFNAGLAMSEFMSAETRRKFLRNCFKKGHLPHNTKRDGDISIRNDNNGLSYMFIRESCGVWKHLHVHNWEKDHGVVPEGFIVAFKTTNRMNCDVSNLELITREENMLRNSIQNYPPELRLAMKSLKKLKHQING